MYPNLQQNFQVFSLKIVIYKISFLTMHQTYDTIFASQLCDRGIQEHRLPRKDFEIFLQLNKTFLHEIL